MTMGTCITGLSDFEIEYREGLPTQITMSRQREEVSPNQKDCVLGLVSTPPRDTVAFPLLIGCFFEILLMHALAWLIIPSRSQVKVVAARTVCIESCMHACTEFFFLIDSRSSSQPLQLLFNCVFDHLVTSIDYVDYVRT